MPAVPAADEPHRVAGSDAERRAALALVRRLRAAGREVEVVTHWVRPRREPALAALAVAGIAASVVAVDRPRLGLAIAVAALVLTGLEAAGIAVLSRLTHARATQDVLSPAPGPRPVALVLTAAIDAPRGGVLRRVPHPALAQAAALALVAAACGARALGAEGTALGAAQLVPTTALVLLVAGWVDAALAGAAGRDAAGPEAVLELAAELDRLPPRHLGVEVLLTGAGDAGLRRWARADRRPRADTAVLQLRPGGEPPVWLTPTHPEFARAAARAAREEGHLGARARRGTPPLRRRPALAVRGEQRALVDFALALVTALDEQLAA